MGGQFSLFPRVSITSVVADHPSVRLYFTSFPHPPPRPDALNELAKDPENTPDVRGAPRGSSSATPEDDAQYWYFTIDDQLLYLSFFQDWGPLNLAMVYKACIYIHELLEVSGGSVCVCSNVIKVGRVQG